MKFISPKLSRLISRFLRDLQRSLRFEWFFCLLLCWLLALADCFRIVNVRINGRNQPDALPLAQAILNRRLRTVENVQIPRKKSLQEEALLEFLEARVRHFYLMHGRNAFSGRTYQTMVQSRNQQVDRVRPFATAIPLPAGSTIWLELITQPDLEVTTISSPSDMIAESDMPVAQILNEEKVYGNSNNPVVEGMNIVNPVEGMNIVNPVEGMNIVNPVEGMNNINPVEGMNTRNAEANDDGDEAMVRPFPQPDVVTASGITGAEGSINNAKGDSLGDQGALLDDFGDGSDKEGEGGETLGQKDGFLDYDFGDGYEDGGDAGGDQLGQQGGLLDDDYGDVDSGFFQ